MIRVMTEPLEHQLTFRCLLSVFGRFEGLLAQLRARGRLMYKGRRVTREGIVNALLLHVSDLPPDQAESFLGPLLGRVESALAGNDPGAGPAASPAAVPPPLGSEIDIRSATPPASASPRVRRKKGG